MRADLNPGITKFVDKSGEYFYKKWIRAVKNTFDIVIKKTDSECMIAEGSLTKIIEFEDYLQKKFPELPGAEKINGECDSLKFEDEFYDVPSKIMHCVMMSKKEAEEILKKFSGEISKAKINYSIEKLETFKNGLRILCKPQMKNIITDFFNSLVKKYASGGNLWSNSSEFPFKFRKHCFSYKGIRVNVLKADICDLKVHVDCIVSSVNSRMNVSHGVAKAIATKAGDKYKKALQESVKLHGDLKQTQCRPLEPGNLDCKQVLHVNFNSAKLTEVNSQTLNTLHTSIRSCFDLANSLQYSSIAMPMLGTGKHFSYFHLIYL